jgi:hypothetical protein
LFDQLTKSVPEINICYVPISGSYNCYTGVGVIWRMLINQNNYVVLSFLCQCMSNVLRQYNNFRSNLYILCVISQNKTPIVILTRVATAYSMSKIVLWTKAQSCGTTEQAKLHVHGAMDNNKLNTIKLN